MNPLSDADVKNALKALPGWSHQDNKLVRAVKTGSLMDAVELVTRIAHISDAQDHHPDILIQSARVTISTFTHDAQDKVSERDVELAQAISPLMDAVKA